MTALRLLTTVAAMAAVAAGGIAMVVPFHPAPGAAGEPRVHVRVLARGPGVDVRISDEGPGIPPSLRAKIFEPRFTTKPAGRGSGLGLHVARRLMARQGGDVFLVEEGDPARLPWAATEFCIAVPAPPPRPPDLAGDSGAHPNFEGGEL